MMLRPPNGRGQIAPASVSAMKGLGPWWIDLRRAAVESSNLGRNWRWMLVSLGIGAGLGLVAGLIRQGAAPASLSLDVVVAMLRVAIFAVVVAWFVAVAIRFGRLRRS